MIVGREEVQRREDAELAPYAVRSALSRGRRIAEPEDPYRTPFQRDRDRIIHSSAYRRLGNKTQVFITFEGEHYRTRLTHTEEATQIAVTVARALAANQDLTEAISRAHDLGHAPFGHAGQDALATRMAGRGGFEHNLQTLRVLDDLEVEYPDFRGLNVTMEVRDGVLAHGGAQDEEDQGYPGHRDEAAIVPTRPSTIGQPSIEAQIADVADEIAYGCHDLQDGLASGLVRREDVARADLPWWQEAVRAVTPRGGALSPDLERRRVKGYLINRFISDLIVASAARLAVAGADTPDEVRLLPERVIALSPPVRTMRESLHSYLAAHLYRHQEVVTMGEKAKRLLTELFDAYSATPDQLPAAVLARAASGLSLDRAICDHIASMTDRGAVREHHRLYDVDAQVLP